MKTLGLILSALCLWTNFGFGQEYVIDPQHLVAVMENGMARSAAESTHDQYLSNIKDRVNTINTNTGSIVLAQTMIYRALANVNSALKDGLEVKHIAAVIADITRYTGQAVELARQQPALLPVASRLSDEMRSHAELLVTDVSDFVLKEGDNVLADYNARDMLLRKVVQQLQIMDGLAYGAWRAMYWANVQGVFRALNPFRDYIAHDQVYIGQIIAHAKYLTK